MAVSSLKHDEMLYAWEHGYDGGTWSDERAVAACTHRDPLPVVAASQQAVSTTDPFRKLLRPRAASARGLALASKRCHSLSVRPWRTRSRSRGGPAAASVGLGTWTSENDLLCMRVLQTKVCTKRFAK